jgi:hypothetical protein
MKVYIRPGKVTCAGLVGIMLVLPSSIWKGTWADAKVRVVKAQDARSGKKPRD